jgi:hypothetical protein
MHKRMLQLALLWVLGACAVMPAVAQSVVKVNVPFEFSISGRALQAGQYLVSLSHGKLTVQDSMGKSVFMGMTNQVSGRRVDRTGMLVFRCYGSRCFLSEFWTPTAENGSQLLRSRQESASARYRRGTEFALLARP